MLKRIGIIQVFTPLEHARFSLDPLAEYLAALHLLDLYGEKEEDWKNFLTEADDKDGAPETIKGFLLAVRDCIIAKGEKAKIPDFVADELAKRAALDPRALEKAQLKQRIQRLINQLSFPEVSDRQYAIKSLGEIGPEAKAAVPNLSEALKDEGEDVRRAAAEALGKIGPEAKSAMPVLIETLSDEELYVRKNAAEVLDKINSPEAMKALKEYKQKSK